MASTTYEPRVLPNQLSNARLAAFARLVPHALVMIIFMVGIFFAHELGHALAAQFFGARVVMFNVLGMQWFPQLEWMPHLGFGGYVYWFAPVSLTNHRLIMMAGSNFTMLLAIGAALALNVSSVRGLLRTTLAVMSFYFFDSVVHVLPIIGLIPPGWNSRFTRTFSEAYFAALGLGIPSQVYLAAIFILTALILVLLVRGLVRSRSQATPDKSFA